MFKLKMKGTGSWLDPQSARQLSARLMMRLWERCRGHKGLFVTLTYRRDEYKDAMDLYRKQGEEQHVALFIRKLGRYLKKDLRGKWFCKLEFQKGGWVHWHIIILDVDRIPHSEVERMWGYGFVWLKKMSQKNIRYACKYAVKGGECPAWLYGERPRSIKIVRVSSGFWTGKKAAPKGRGGEEKEEDHYDKYGPSPPQRISGYVPIGTKIDRFEKDYVACEMKSNGENAYVSGQCDLGTVLGALYERGKRIVDTVKGWLVIDGTLKDLQIAMERAYDYTMEQKASGALHLNVSSKHDANQGEGRLDRWLDEWFRQEAEENYDYVIG